jgi:adenylate kinase family enzyme
MRGNLNNLKRIAIVGVSGSGKTTTSKILCNYFDLPLYHIDDLIWKNQSEVVEKQEYISNHNILVKKEKWIIEGYIDEEMACRLSRADLVVYLNYPRAKTMFRYLKRWLVSLISIMPSDNYKKPHGNLLARVMIIFDFFRQTEKKDIQDALKTVSKDKIIEVQTSKDMATLISNIANKYSLSKNKILLVSRQININMI